MDELTLKFVVPGKPIAKKRPRFFRRGKGVGTYNCQETEVGRMLWEINRQLPAGWIPLKSPIQITTVFYMARPKSHYGTGNNKTKLKESSQFQHTSKPDLDNLQKMIYDCFNQVVWVDDSLVCETHSRKEYSENPRTEIIITEVFKDGKGSEESKR